MLKILQIILGVVIILFVFYKFVFLRDPSRKISSGNNLVAPADGRVINIIEIKKGDIKIKKGFGNVISDADDGYLISIFMSIFNVHVNRAPIEGKIVSVKHKAGKFFMAFDIEKSLLNESNEIIMDTKIGKIKIIQIAGFVARRIRCYVEKNQKINKGEKIGMIVIGSQVSMIVPKIKLAVKIGDKVKAGQTVIGEF